MGQGTQVGSSQVNMHESPTQPSPAGLQHLFGGYELTCMPERSRLLKSIAALRMLSNSKMLLIYA